MIDLTTLSAPATAPIANGTTATASVAGTPSGSGSPMPSTEGFLQVLEMFLGGSPLPSSFMANTAITQTTGAETAATGSDMDLPQIQSSLGEPKELDVNTCEAIASLLQTLGFQVKPAEIQELSALDRQQLDTALEFVQRNLERGTSPALVAENAALLLPRPWPLDDADGSPVGTTAVTAATETHPSIPADLVQNIKDVRAKLHSSLGDLRLNEHETQQAASEGVAQYGTTTAKDDGAGSKTGGQQSFDRQSGQKQSAFRDTTTASPPAWMQSIQSAVPDSESPEKTAITQVPKHLSPGGTTSELIGRQVLEKVHLQLGEGHREIKLRLWPEELGEVRMALKMTDGEKVHANIVVENDAVRQAMLDATPQLKEALARHGLDLERLSVSVSQKDAQEAGTDGAGKDGRRESGKNRSGENGWHSADVAIAEEVVLGEDTGKRNGRNTIDLWS